MNPLSFSGPVPPRYKRIDSALLVLGEGTHEALFFSRLLEHMGILTVQAGDYGGAQNLRASLHAIKTTPGYRGLRALALTRDADDDPRGGFVAVRDALKDEGFPVPSGPACFTPDRPSLGVFLLPDCRSAGMLETLCIRTIEDDPGLECARQYFGCLAARAGWKGDSLRKREKSLAHAWLASQDKPDLHPGTAAVEKYWRFDSPPMDPLKRFIGELARL